MRNLVTILMITSFLIIPAVSKAKLRADESLALYLSFDEGKGEIAQDISQYGNNGTIKGGIKWVDGKFGKALEFDGTTGYIEIPHSDSLNVEAEFTLENWAYPEDTSREQNVAEKGFWKGSWLDHIKTVRGYVHFIQ